MQQRAILDDQGVLRFHGPDAARFLQGQLSSDVMRLGTQRGQLAGYHNPQGRAIAVLRLVQAGPEEILAVLPRELTAPVANRLARFVLRAKVKITDVSADWQVSGVSADSAATTAPRSLRIQVGPDASCWLELDPADRGARDAGGAEAPQAWRRREIAAGLPQIYAATSEEFVAQMLNLDALDAIAFDKGCYTGQEVIARAHYRGRVKRRMQRFQSQEPCRLSPGDGGRFSDGRSFKVVQAVPLLDGRSEFLAVTAVAAADADESATADSAAAAALKASALPLPYTLPE